MSRPKVYCCVVRIDDPVWVIIKAFDLFNLIILAFRSSFPEPVFCRGILDEYEFVSVCKGSFSQITNFNSLIFIICSLDVGIYEVLPFKISTNWCDGVCYFFIFNCIKYVINWVKLVDRQICLFDVEIVNLSDDSKSFTIREANWGERNIPIHSKIWSFDLFTRS